MVDIPSGMTLPGKLLHWWQRWDITSTMDTDVLFGPMTSPSGDIPETSDKQFLEYSKLRLSEIKARNGMAYNTCNTLRYTPVGVSSNSPAFGDGSLRPKTTMPTQSTPRPMTPDYGPTEA